MSPRADKESLSPEERDRLRRDALEERARLKREFELHSEQSRRATELIDKQRHEDKIKKQELEQEVLDLRRQQFVQELQGLGLELLENRDSYIAKRSNMKLRMMCISCGAELLLSPYKVFYRSQKRRPCPYCAGLDAEREASKAKSFQVALSSDQAQELDSVFEYWKSRRSKKFAFLGFDAERSAFESLSSFSDFILEAAIRSLSLDTKNQKRIDELAQFIRHEYGPDLDELTAIDMSVVSQRFLDAWGKEEHSMFFDLIWPLALQRAQEGPDEPEIDPELLLRKKQLQDLLGSVDN